MVRLFSKLVAILDQGAEVVDLGGGAGEMVAEEGDGRRRREVIIDIGERYHISICMACIWFFNG